MRIRSPRTEPGTGPPGAEEAVVAAVDAALGFIAGQQWVRRQTAVALLEGIRDAARNLDAPQRLDKLIDLAVADCDHDRILSAPLTDLLLDIRNSSRDPRTPARPLR
jgi:hypothetical protein